ncbi:MAG TPA: hypothetical protein VLA46_00915 [Saprospiraceae bacterium]|nr:hypothetical protein [Saprospiraceae bacterium]
MNLLHIRFSLLLFLQISCVSGNTQQKDVPAGLTDTSGKYLLAIRQHSSQGFSFYNDEGQFLFKLDADHQPILHDDEEEENFYKVDFSYGVIPVTTKSGFYLLDAAGTIIKQFDGTFQLVDPIHHGYVIAYRKTREDDRVVEYYDRNGNRAMGSKAYAEGSDVINHVALVQLEIPGTPSGQTDGDWILVSGSGEVIKNISKTTGKKFHFYSESFDGYWKLRLDGEPGNIYVFPDGQITSSPGKPTADLHRDRLYAHADSIAKARNYVPSSLSRSWLVHFVDSTLFCIAYDATNPKAKPRVMDAEMNEVRIEKPGSDLWPQRFYNRYVLLEDKKDGKVTGLYLFNLKTRKISTQLPNEPDQVIDHLFVFHVPFSPQTIVGKIITGEGETIYELPEHDRYMSSIEDVIANRDSVKLVDLTNPSMYGLEQIKELPNAEVFELNQYKGQTIPEGFFTHWNQLAYVRFVDCESLTTLPEAMKGLPKLREVHLVNCEEMEDISPWIESWPSLSYISSFYAPSEEIIQKFPHIEFDYLFYRDE